MRWLRRCAHLKGHAETKGAASGGCLSRVEGVSACLPTSEFTHERQNAQTEVCGMQAWDTSENATLAHAHTCAMAR